MNTDHECMNIVNSKITASILLTNYHLIEMVYAKVYTANKTGKDWLYSDIAGNLCLVIDYNRGAARLMMFEIHNYQIVFETELYKKFDNAYTKGDDTFHYFEISGGFIGFYIKDKANASTFYDIIKSLSDDKIQKLVKGKKNIYSNEIKSHAEVIKNMIKHKITEEYFFKKTELNESEIRLTGRKIERMLGLIEWDKKDKLFRMKGNSYEMMRLIQSVQKVKQVDNRKMHVDDIREYAKQLSISIVNSQKNLKKIPNKQPQPQLSEVKKVPINLVEQKKPDYVKPEMFKTKEVVKPKEVVKEVVKEVPKTNKGAPSKVPPLPKGAVPPVPLGLLPPVAKPKDTTTNTTNNTNINKFNTNTNTNTNNTTNNTINTNNTNNTNNINLNPTHNTQNNNTTTTTHTSENNHHQDNEETQEKKPFQPTLPVKKIWPKNLKIKWKR